MASSDDESEVVPQSVAGYFFEDANDNPVSFSVLPFSFDSTEKQDSSKGQVFLRGTGDSGCEKVYKEVTGWSLGLEDVHPEIMVRTKDGKWIKLLKPRKSYESVIRTILITTQLLHYLRRNPESSEKSVWEHLRRVFSTFDDTPSANDLLDHYPLIKMLVERDDALAKSQLLLTLLKEKPRKRTFGEALQNDLDTKKSFIVDDLEDDMGNNDGDESDEEPDLFDSVCAICDNGGEILCCEGRCMRSFHATKEDGEDSDCKSLGFSRVQYKAIQNQNFLCGNCKYKRHQCFVCGKLGSSDKSTGAEVFACVNATCGHFYHPQCVAGLLFPENKTEAAECEKKIAGGESFACPVHKCHVCKQGENKEDVELQFAVCRRCPRSYHRKCLPRKIAFEDVEEEGILQRAWDDLLPNRILIYCLRHKIDEDLGTPIRNHILFAESPESRKTLDVQKNKAKVLVKKKISGNLPQERTSLKPVKSTQKLYSPEGREPVARSSFTKQVLNFHKQLRPSKINAEPELHDTDGSLVDSKNSPKGKVNAAVSTPTSSAKVAVSSFPKIDVETQNEMVAFMKSASSSLTLADIKRKRMMPSTHTQTVRNVDQSITSGKVEGSVEAVKTALKKLEDGGNVEDAKAVCEPDILKQIMRWNNKLKVYLAPFLHGMRYTSFGRHFTKVDKLKEIVDKLQWYVQNGDTIVDFCCGANDFSRLMKEKLDAAGKECSYRNFDVIHPKYDFNFEKRDWMTVQPDELPPGSQLIMGLNPPFGVKSSLANKFIDKALTFKPKLVVLIVPSETERLDKKRSSYDLIWEDCEKLSGKSFYLPGSVDVNDMQIEQWNVKPPPLYLWSRPDWTAKHRAIALKQGHIFDGKNELPAEEPEKFRVSRSPEGCQNKEAMTPDTVTKEENDLRSRPDWTAKHGAVALKQGQIPDVKHELPAEEKGKFLVTRSPETRENKKAMIQNKEAMILDTIPKEENAKTDTESKKIPQEENNKTETANHSSRSARRKAAKRKALNEAKRRKLEAEDGKKEAEGSDMSISPPKISEILNTPVPIETVEAPRESFQTFAERTNSVVVEDIQDIARRYATPSISRAHNWSNDTISGHRDYMTPNLEESFSGYDSRLGYRRSLDVDTRLPLARFSPGISDSALGHNDMFTPSSYGLSNSIAGSSVMQRYAPRLDEMSFPRGTDNLGRNSGLDMHGMGGNLPPNPYGFAPGSQRQFPHNNSGGWLDD